MVILDEAPTLFIPNFQQTPATARSNELTTIYAVLDVAHVEGTLGPQVSEMIISNLSNQFLAAQPILKRPKELAGYLENMTGLVKLSLSNRAIIIVVSDEATASSNATG